jgi:multisubunit Na+/H+ antiporter MnhE subunit
VRAFVVWWLALFGTYALLVGSSLSYEEVVAGAALAVLAATLAVAAVRAFDPPRRVPGFAGRMVWLPRDVAVDAVRLTAHVLRLLLLPLSLPGVGGTSSRARVVGRTRGSRDDVLAYAVIAASASPGGYVVQVQDDGRTLDLHRLAPAGKVVEGWLR